VFDLKVNIIHLFLSDNLVGTYELVGRLSVPTLAKFSLNTSMCQSIFPTKIRCSSGKVPIQDISPEVIVSPVFLKNKIGETIFFRS
jgi:hypothetical protein